MTYIKLKDPINQVLFLILVHVLLLSVSIFLSFCLTAIKNHVIKYCETVFERNGKNLCWSIKNSNLKNKSKGFLASSMSTYDFSTLYTTLSHYQSKETLTKLFEQTFNRDGSLIGRVTFKQPKIFNLESCQRFFDDHHFLLDNIFIRFG